MNATVPLPAALPLLRRFSQALRYNGRLVRLAGVRSAPGAKVAELVDALALGASGATRKSSSLFFRTSS